MYCVFFFNDTATTEIYTLSLHDALPICRDLTLPIDGVTSRTRPVGKHQLSFTEGANPFAKLPPGEYKLVVEGAREVGGREVVTVPFKWPAAKAEQLSAKGSSELGEISLELKP